MSNAGGKPSTTITIVDPLTHAKLDKVKADTEAILAKLAKPEEQPQEAPRYFPRGYFP
jgi:hypothetical protein